MTEPVTALRLEQLAEAVRLAELADTMVQALEWTAEGGPAGRAAPGRARSQADIGNPAELAVAYGAAAAAHAALAAVPAELWQAYRLRVALAVRVAAECEHGFPRSDQLHQQRYHREG